MKKSTFIVTVVIVFLVLAIIVLLTYIFIQKLKIDNQKMQEINRNIQILDEPVIKLEDSNEHISKVQFNDNQIIAIAHITKENKDEFIKKYFTNIKQYNNIKTLDMRTKLVNSIYNEPYGNEFIIIPQNDDIKITVRTCILNFNNEIELDQIALKNHTGPLILYTNEIEVVPPLCVIFEYNGYIGQIPLLFKGTDGTIDLTGNEMEVKDISIY